MIHNPKQPNQPPCPPWALLLQFAVQPETMTRRQRKSLGEHVDQCERCGDEYVALCDANAALWNEAAEILSLPKLEPQTPRSPEASLADLWRRIDADEAQQRRRQHRASLLRIGSVAAACILIAIAASFLIRGNRNTDRPVSGGTADIKQVEAPFAEMVMEQIRKPLTLNQPITTDARPQEILLGGMHRVVMNRNTTAAFTAVRTQTQTTAPQSDGIVYEVRLTKGELYVEVVPGHPFTVTTNNARLDITGTKFDVISDTDRTELVVLEGSVRFSPLACRRHLPECGIVRPPDGLPFAGDARAMAVGRGAIYTDE